jgi:hypothetical protein
MLLHIFFESEGSYESEATVAAKRVFEKSWQIKTHGAGIRVCPSCLEGGMEEHSR